MFLFNKKLSEIAPFFCLEKSNIGGELFYWNSMCLSLFYYHREKRKKAMFDAVYHRGKKAMYSQKEKTVTEYLPQSQRKKEKKQC